MLKRLKKLHGENVEITWLDPCGYINESLDDVKVEPCVSMGKLIHVDCEKIILQTSQYSNDPKCGDYTAITVGCIVNAKNFA
jgi:hypothetical protein